MVTSARTSALVLTTLALPYPLVLVCVLLIGALGGIAHRARPDPSDHQGARVHAGHRDVRDRAADQGRDLSCASATARTRSMGRSARIRSLPPGLRFNPTSLWIFACTALVTIGVMLFFSYTRLGKAMRAVSVNPEAARLMGIRVDAVCRWSWAISTAIGALAGLLVAPVIGINPEIGTADPARAAGRGHRRLHQRRRARSLADSRSG